MKIGKLIFKEYAAQKPVMVTESGSMLSLVEVVSAPRYEFRSLLTASRESQIRIALERYKQEPDFQLAIFDNGVMRKAEVIGQIEQQTDFGKLAVKVEMQYCNELMQFIREKRVVAYPKMPRRPVVEFPEWKQVNRCFWFRLTSTVLFAENTTDSVTEPFALYRLENVHPAFEGRGFHVVANTGTSDTRTNFVNTAKKALTVYLGGIGHGSEDAYTGHAGREILEVGAYDAEVVKNKAIHFLSCRTAASLGPDTVNKGAKCYAGYDENFTFIWDDPATPLVEADLFKKSDSTFDLYMANGFTAQQAYDATIATFNASIALVPGTVAASWLSYDRDHLRLIGNADTKIAPYRYVKICLPIKNLLHEEMLAGIGELTD